MAQVTFLPSVERPPLDQSLLENAQTAERAGRAIRIRVQPDLYNHDKQGYTSWQGLTWTIEMDSVEEGKRLREGLTHFFGAFAGRQEELLKVLRGL